MLEELNLGDGHNLGTTDGQIALDCSIRTTKQGHICISTTDFFFPLVSSPYLQGRIGAANVLSDMYATGVENVDFVLMLLAACRDMPLRERNICTTEMIRGFRDACVEDASTVITGGQTVLNPWPIIGGVATSIVSSRNDYVPSDGAQIGNVVVLTKPLGTQVAVNVHQWRMENNKSNSNHTYWQQCISEKVLDDDMAEEAMHKAVCSMVRLNRNAAKLMLKHGATAATDVTGFGILGHAQNLSSNQVAPVGIEIHTLPIITGMADVDDRILNFNLLQGYSAETSGGLLVCLPSEASATTYCQELKELDDDNCPSWIIGRVVANTQRKSTIVDNVKVLSV